MHPEEAQHQIKHTNRPCFTLSFCSTASRWLNMTGTASNRGRGSSSSPRRLPTWSRRPRSNREFCTRRSKVRRTWWCLSLRTTRCVFIYSCQVSVLLAAGISVSNLTDGIIVFHITCEDPKQKVCGYVVLSRYLGFSGILSCGGTNQDS